MVAAPGCSGRGPSGAARCLCSRLEDALGGVALLAGRVLALRENLVNDRPERLQLPLGSVSGLAIAPRFDDVCGASTMRA